MRDRSGLPAPLILHLASAAEIYESGARLAPLAATDRFPWAAPPSSEMAATARAVSAARQPDMAIALRREAARRLKELAVGIRCYQASAHARTLPDPAVIWRQGAARLLDFGPEGGAATLVIPSLVNRHHILDLDTDCSLLRYLSGRGLRPLLLDWGEPGREERQLDASGYVLRHLEPAFDAVRGITGAAPVGLIGYCIGGTLAAALAARRGDQITKAAMIGAPWDFSEMVPMRGALASLGISGDRAMLRRLIADTAAVFGAIPVDLLQAVFAQIDPGLASRKFRRLAALDPEGAEARRFVLIEDWLNDGPPLSGPAACEALIDWHMDNAPARGIWQIGGRVVRAADITAPLLIAAATRDRITPSAAAEALAHAAPYAEVIRPEAGHVGMIVGRDAMRQLWKPVADFLLR